MLSFMRKKGDSKDKASAAESAEAAAAIAEAVVAAQQVASFPQPDREVIIGVETNRSHQFLQDVILLHRIVYKLCGKAAPKKEADVDALAGNLYTLLKDGKPYQIGGCKDVPSPFLNSKGLFFAKSGDDSEMRDAKKKLRKVVFDEFKNDLPSSIDLSESPYKEFKESLLRKSTGEDEGLTPEIKDVLLYATDGSPPCEKQAGNNAIFNFASNTVNHTTDSSEKRVKAALSVVDELDSMDIAVDESSQKPISKVSRFLVRTPTGEDSVTWKLLPIVDATEVALAFVFEVFLEKEIHAAPAAPAIDPESTKPGTQPVSEPTEHDVLFGRGGMTNTHSGNKRFRDIIALHRPDYIRAIKTEKPGVARKIVKAIRQGTPPGRFLKKAEDGMWYDVGDRTAAEKTSQGLRERTNAEKRQRSALREALRIRKEDLEEGPDGENPVAKKAKLAVAEEAVAVATLNYTGTNLAVPLSLGMKEKKAPAAKAKKAGKYHTELDTEGLPPNAVDEEGNILVTDHDILCGRGGLTNHHKGNKRFRDVVALHRPDYVRAPKIQKPSVARVIVRAIRNGDPPGRFLRKDEKTGRWYDIGDKKAAEKTSQALREKTNEEREKLKSEPGSVGVLLPSPASYMAAAPAVAAGGSPAAGAKKGGKKDDKKAKKQDAAQTAEI